MNEIRNTYIYVDRCVSFNCFYCNPNEISFILTMDTIAYFWSLLPLNSRGKKWQKMVRIISPFLYSLLQFQMSSSSNWTMQRKYFLPPSSEYLCFLPYWSPPKTKSVKLPPSFLGRHKQNWFSKCNRLNFKSVWLESDGKTLDVVQKPLANFLLKIV